MKMKIPCVHAPKLKVVDEELNIIKCQMACKIVSFPHENCRGSVVGNDVVGEQDCYTPAFLPGGDNG